MLTKLGKYEIKSELGHGGMGVVYRAEDTLLERPVALKIMPPRVAQDPELVTRFYREARSAGRLQHRNIVIIYEIDQIEGTHFIAMEFLEGETLEQIIAARKDLAVVQKLDIISQACRGLHYAHQRGVVHRDVKPANIMMGVPLPCDKALDDGLVKIVDFGIAHIAAGTALTQGGARLGTPFYMSPEHFSGPTVDARADVFSLGVVLYELLSYRKPFADQDLRSLWLKVMSQNPEPLTRLLPDCPLQLERAVMKALAKQREDRYQTAEDLAFDLQQVKDLLRHQRVELYVKEGRRSLEDGNFTVAKEAFRKALEVDSSHDLAKSLLGQVEEQIETRRRAEKIDQNLRQAHEARQAGQFNQAIALFDEILQFSPEHEVARESRRMAVEERDRAQKINQHMERAEGLTVNADWQAAQAELEAVLALDPKHSAALQMRDWVLKELAAQERQHQVSQYTDEARTCLARKDFEQAMELLEKALALDPINIEVEALMRQVRSTQEQEVRKRRLEQRLAAVQDALNREELDQAVTLAEEALREFSDDPRLLKLHAQASRLAEEKKKRQYVEEQLQTARRFFQKNQYTEALAVLQAGLETVPDDARLVSFLKTVEDTQQRVAAETVCRQALRDANELIREKNFALAIETLERAQVRVGDSPELRELLQLARDQQAERQRQERVRQVLGRARTFQRDENYEEAIRVLEVAQRELGGSEIDNPLAALREKWQKFKQRQQETLERGRQLLEAGEAAKAVAVLEAAPQAYFRNEQFQLLYAQSHEALRRAKAVRSAVEQIEENISSEKLDQAETLLRQALQIYPKDPALLAAERRLGDEQQRYRRAQCAKLLDEAKVAIGRMEYRRAVEILTSLPPESGEDPKLSSDVRSLLEQARRSERQSSVRQQAIRDADARIRNKEFAAAIGILEQALAVAGQSPELVDRLRLARTQRDQQQKQERATQVINRAHSYLEEGNYEETVALLEGAQRELGVREIDKELTAARERQRKFEQQREEILGGARQLLQGSKPAEALALLEAAPPVLLKDERIQSVYAQCREAAARASSVRATLVAQAQALQRDDNYEGAVRILEQAQSQLGAAEVRALLESAREQWRQFEERQKETLANVRHLLEAGEATQAQAVLDAAPKAYFKNPQFSEIYAECTEKAARSVFVRSTLQQFEQYMGSEDFTQAEDLLRRALQTYPYDPALLAAQKRFEEVRSGWWHAQWRKVIDEAKVAFGRREYQRTVDLLVALPPEIATIPELASEAAALLDDARESEQRLSVAQEAARVARERMQAEDYPGAIETLERALAVAGQSTELADLLKFARERQAEQVRQERVRQVLDEASKLQRDDSYEDAVSVLERARAELGADQIDKLLLSLREQGQRFEQRRKQTLERARKWVESGEPAKAVALIDAAPRGYFKSEEFRRFSAECKEKLARTNFIRSAVGQVQACLGAGDFSRAEAVLEQAFADNADDPDLLAARARLQKERVRYGRAQGRKAVDDAKIALGRRKYRQAVELLSALPPEVAALPEVSSEVTRLLEEARRGQQELEQRQVLIEQPPSVPAEAAPASDRAKRLPATIGAVLGALVVILVAYGISRRVGSHAGSHLGQLQLNAVPWAEVLSVRKADGKDLHITGQTPMELELSPGKYVIALKNGKGAGKVDVVVEPGKLSAVNYNFPDVNVDQIVDELVSKY